MSTERLEQLFSFLKTEPSDPFLKYAIATEYNSENKFEEALKFYEDLLLNHPDYVGTYYHVGKLYQKLGDNQKAQFAFEKGIEVAQKVRNMHASNELRGALNELLDADDEW